MWPWSRNFSPEPSRPDLSLGEFVIVEGRSGVLVPRPVIVEERSGVLVARPLSDEDLLAVWFGQTVGENPVVELVLPDRVYRWDGYHGPVYYH